MSFLIGFLPLGTDFQGFGKHVEEILGYFVHILKPKKGEIESDLKTKIWRH